MSIGKGRRTLKIHPIQQTTTDCETWVILFCSKHW